LLKQFLKRNSTIQQRVLAVKMKMCKSFIRHNLRGSFDQTTLKQYHSFLLSFCQMNTSKHRNI
jgi:hypothetical protein